VRTSVSSLYLVATLGSACTLPFVGRALDRFGPPLVFFAASLGLGATCLFYSTFCSSPLTLVVSFYFLRLCGQGTLWLVSTTAVNLWFEKKRGRVMSVCTFVNNVALTGLFSALTKKSVLAIGWRSTYWNLALLELCVVMPLGCLLMPRRPEAYGLFIDGVDSLDDAKVPGEKGIVAATVAAHSECAPLKAAIGVDGALPLEADAEEGTTNGGPVGSTNGDDGMDDHCSPGPGMILGREYDRKPKLTLPIGNNGAPSSTTATIEPEESDDFTRAEALKTIAFWSLCSSCFTIAALGTALFFHLDSIFPTAGGYEPYLERVYLSSAASAAITTLITGPMVDYVEPAPLMGVALLFNGLMLVSCSAVVHSSMYMPLYLVGGFNGVSMGIFGLVAGVTHAKWFGRSHLGEIQGCATALTVLGSAVGPAAVSLGRDLLDGYWKVLLLFAMIPATLAIQMFSLKAPEKTRRDRSSAV